MLAQADVEPVKVNDPEEDNETSLLLSGSEATIPPDDDEQQISRRQIHMASPIEFGENEDHDQNAYLPAIVIEDADRLQPARKRVFHSFPNSPNQSRVDLAITETISPANSSPTTTDGDRSDDETSLPRHHTPRSPTVPTSSRFQSFRRRSRRGLVRTWRTFNEFMTVPLWAALLSLIVACVRPLQHALEEHMQPVKGALASAGNCSIPLTLVVLGAYFYSPKATAEDGSMGKNLPSLKSSRSLYDSIRDVFKVKKHWGNHRRADSNGSMSTMPKSEGRPGETKTVVIAILSRMIIVPLLLIPLMAASTWYDWHAIFAE